MPTLATWCQRTYIRYILYNRDFIYLPILYTTFISSRYEEYMKQILQITKTKNSQNWFKQQQQKKKETKKNNSNTRKNKTNLNQNKT